MKMSNLSLLNDQSIPQGMVTLLNNRNIIDKNFLSGIENIQSLEMEIFRLVKEYKGQEDILRRVFHLVQIWGGMSGRYVYTRQKFEWGNIRDTYKQIVETCLSIHDSDVKSQNALYEKLKKFRIPYVGVAFMTKHTRFWLTATCGDDVLPIYDKYMALRVMKLKQASWRTLPGYWEEMRKIAIKKDVSLLYLEREMTNEER